MDINRSRELSHAIRYSCLRTRASASATCASSPVRGTGIGRATAIAAAANNLMTVGLDINEKEGKKTQKIARDLGGQMIFMKTNLCNDAELTQAVADAAKLGAITFVANIAGLQHIDSIDNFPMENMT